VEASRQQAQAKVLLLQQQLVQARANGNRVLFQAPQLEANAELYKQYQATEARLSDLRSRLRDNDELVRNLQRKRLSLIATLNRQTIGLLQGELATAQAALQASSRPKEVVLKHRELVRQAIRDEKTLAELENQLQIAQLEQAKQTEPWELISTPTLLDAPVAPKKSRIMALGLLAGLTGLDELNRRRLDRRRLDHRVSLLKGRERRCAAGLEKHLQLEKHRELLR
jgi:hypothetical protein